MKKKTTEKKRKKRTFHDFFGGNKFKKTSIFLALFLGIKCDEQNKIVSFDKLQMKLVLGKSFPHFVTR